MLVPVLNPSMKLQHIPPESHDDAKKMLRATVRRYCRDLLLASLRWWLSIPKLLPYYEKRTQTATPQTAGPALQAVEISRPLRATNYTPRRSRAIRGRSLRNSTAHRTADEILGLAKSDAPKHGSLDAEIENYLADSSTSKSSLLYWQVNVLGFRHSHT